MEMDGTRVGATTLSVALSVASSRRGLIIESYPKTVAVLNTVVFAFTSKLLVISA